MPKKSIDRNPITIVSSQGTDSANSDSSLVSGLDTSVSASEVISSNDLGGYLGNNVQLNLDDLTSDAQEGQPPRIGFGPLTFSNESYTITHDGRPDWGQAKLIDKAPWLKQRKKWAVRQEMPHYFYGAYTNLFWNPHVNEAKYINENGVYDTINLAYRDNDVNSDQGLDVTTGGLGQGTPYDFNLDPASTQIFQSVPRSAFQSLNPSEIYPFSYKGSFDENVEDFFNSATGTSLGLNAGVGTSSLGVKNGQASINLGSPLRTTTYNVAISEQLTDLTADEPVPQDVGIVVSGILFPADRGVVALIRFPSDTNGVASSFVGNPATTVDDIESRVIGAINLGQGAGPNDGLPGGVIFNNTPRSDFPSRITGQYDLYELHTGNYTTESTRSGAIPDLVATKSSSIGKVRLLTNADAFDGTLTREGGIPVLFSPFEKISKQSVNDTISWSSFYAFSNPETTLGAYVVDSIGTTLEATINTNGAGSIDIDTPSGNTPYTYYAYVKKEERNFLSYRLPILSDYSPNGLKTPSSERDRFFIKRKPNKDQDQILSDYQERFTTAGGYVTFGEYDNYSFQVARYRQVITFTQEYALDGTTSTGIDGGLALDPQEPEYNFGSLVLMHFKTERAFEAFVRDGVAPSDDELYSRSLVDYTTLNNNVGEYLGLTGGDGLTDSETSYKASDALSVFRPNVNFLQKLEQPSINIKTKSQSYGLHPLDSDYDTLDKGNTYHSWVSGVIYASPSSWFAYKGHSSQYNGGQTFNRAVETQHTKFRVDVEITKKAVQGNDSMSDWTNTEASAGLPFETIRPTLQILTSDLTASNNLIADNADYFDDNTETPYPITIKHQQAWANATDLENGFLEGVIGVIPTGDSVKAVNDLSLYDSKQGLCTFTTVGLRPSVLLNNPHKQFENLGVIQVVDDLSANSSAAKKKLLYHSSRKVSLLELCGERLTPTGTYIGGGNAITIDNIYRKDIVGATYGLVGQDYRNNECFAEVYLQALWSNPDNVTNVLTPKSCGQAFSIYRYDEEGYKVYVELELLPIGDDEANGYALELCSGWDWVRNTQIQQINAGVSSDFFYKSEIPVYRTVENTHTRLSVTTHADAKFLAVKNVQYYIETHPSIPFDHDLGINGIPVPEFQVVPAAWPKATQQNSSIYQLSNTWGFGNAGVDADLKLIFSKSLTLANSTDIRIYELLGDTNTYVVDSRGEPINTNVVAAGGAVNSELGATVHICGIQFSTTIPVNPINEWSASSSQIIQHPQPSSSVNKSNQRNFGYEIIEVKPTGRRELPEYGNYTMDIRGYITVSGMGNKPSDSSYDLHAVDTQTRFPLVSLFTPRKDTQERFLDESYRIEHSLSYVFTNDDPDSSFQFGNHSNLAGASPAQGDNQLRENLIGPGIPNFGVGFNGGYISFPVRDEVNYSHYQYKVDVDNYIADPGANPLPDLMNLSNHGRAGYLRNNLHLRRVSTTAPNLDPTDWLEAQVSGFPNMTRNHLSGSKYGTPPRGVLVYPYQNFNGLTDSEFGYDLNHTNNAAANRNPLLDSHVGYYLPNSNAGVPNSFDHINSGEDWIDDLTATEPVLRHAQPNYNLSVKPDVGYLRAFDLNFGKSNERTPHIPYWNRDWTETTTIGDQIDRLASDADSQGLIEASEWNRFENNTFTPIKLRLVGVDWDMISYVDPQFPNAHRDGTVYTIDNKQYLMRKRVMRVFVKVPGLTTWLDVGVMNGQVGESYLHYTGNNDLTTFGVMNPNGATSDKTHSSIDGAGCCVSYKETFLVDEGLVALDLELDVGFVPAFNTLGTEDFQGSADEALWLGSHDEYLGEKAKTIWVGNSTKHYGDIEYRKWGAGSKEAPILVKVILSDSTNPNYEVHPSNANALVNRDDLDDTNTLIANVYGQGGNDTIYDIWPTPNKSYQGHSYPPDDRAPTWARRGLMGIEVLRPDGSNFDRDQVIDRPNFTNINLFGEIDTTMSNGADDRTHYMVHIDDVQQVGQTPSGYLRGVDALSHDGTNIVKTNKQTYTFESDVSSTIGVGNRNTLAAKGKG